MLAELSLGVNDRLTLELVEYRDKSLGDGLLVDFHRLFFFV